MRSPLVVTGCARSGTQYVAKVLESLGLRAGHEKIYRPDADARGVDAAWQGRDAEASWLAVPWLWRLPAGAVVVHLVRDPIKVVRCLALHDWFATEDRGNADFVRKHLPACRKGTALEKAAQYALGWNALAEEAGRRAGLRYARVRIEGLRADRLHALLALAGRQVPVVRIEEVLEVIPRDVGACRGHGEGDVTWAQVLRTPAGPALADLARRHGYRPEGVTP